MEAGLLQSGPKITWPKSRRASSCVSVDATGRAGSCAPSLALVGWARKGSGAAWAAAIQKSLEEAQATRAEAARQQAGGGSPAPPRRGDRKGRQLAEASVNGGERDE